MTSSAGADSIVTVNVAVPSDSPTVTLVDDRNGSSSSVMTKSAALLVKVPFDGLLSVNVAVSVVSSLRSVVIGTVMSPVV